MVGDRGDVSRADYDHHRDWDGIDALHLALTDPVTGLGRNGADVQILEGGAAALGDLIGMRRRHLTDLEAEIAQRRRLLLDLDACLSAGRALQAAARDRLATSFVSFVATLFDEAGEVDDDDELGARVKRLEAWASDPQLQQAFQEWSKRFARDQEDWQEATSARIETRFRSAAFVYAFPDGGAPLAVDHLEQQTPAVRLARRRVKELAKLAAGAPRKAVTEIAHSFGHKFRPWGATKLTSKINRAGGAFGVAFGAFEMWSTWQSIHNEGGSERDAAQARSAALREVRQKAEEYFDSTEADAPGASVAESLEQVQRFRDEEAQQMDDAVTEAASLTAAIDACETQMRKALERLEPTGP